MATTSTPKRKRRTLRDIITHNWQQKLISLLCALTVFVVVFYDRNMSVGFEKIPVSFKIPDGYALVEGPSESTVDVRVYGRSSQLRAMSRDDLGIITLTPPPREGNVQVTLLSSMISLPDGVRIEKFVPEFIGLSLEPMDRRTVAVSTDQAFTGELLPGFQLGEVRIVPAEIEITGPRSAIAATSQLYIEPIDLTGKTSTFTINRWIMRNRANISVRSELVEVTVNIVSKSRQQVLPNVPVELLNLTSRYEIIPSRIDLTLVGDDEALSRVDASNLFVSVDASIDEMLGTHTRKLKTSDLSVSNLPEGVAVDTSAIPEILLKVYKDDAPE